jgi:hypothetical protein
LSYFGPTTFYNTTVISWARNWSLIRSRERERKSVKERAKERERKKESERKRAKERERKKESERKRAKKRAA